MMPHGFLRAAAIRNATLETKTVAGQKYNVTLEYIERAGGANAKLQWSGPNISKQVVPQANLFS